MKKKILFIFLFILNILNIANADLIEKYFDYEINSSLTYLNLNGNIDNIINVVNGKLNNDNMKSGFKLYEILGTTPAAGQQGRIIYNTTDNTLNFDTGSIFNQSLIYTGTPAQGDMVYYGSGTSFNLLVAGTSGNILKTNGAGANPSWTDTSPNSEKVDNFSLTEAFTINKVSGRQVFTSNGNFTAPASITQVYLSGCGGGGGGGGTTVASSGGGGGASGGMVIKYPYTVTPTSVYAVAIGALGAGGAAGDNNGASGGNTTFDSSVTATGGSGGSKGTLQTAGTSPGNALNANGQTAGNYIYGGSGADGAGGNPAVGGGGGGCFFGAGGAGGNTSTAGSDGSGYCSGGGGAGSGAIRAGGSGAAGILIVEW